MGKQKTSSHRNDKVSRENKSLWSPSDDDRTLDHFSPTDTDLGNGKSMVDHFLDQASERKKSLEAEGKPAVSKLDSESEFADDEGDAKTRSNKKRNQEKRSKNSAKDRNLEASAKVSQGKGGKSGGKHKVHQSSYTYETPQEVTRKYGKQNTEEKDDESLKSPHAPSAGSNMFALLYVDD